MRNFSKGGKHGCTKTCPQCGTFCDMKHRNPLAAYHAHIKMEVTWDGRTHHTTDWGPA